MSTAELGQVWVLDRDGDWITLGDDCLRRLPDADGTRCWEVEVPDYLDIAWPTQVLIAVMPANTSVIVTPARRKEEAA